MLRCRSGSPFASAAGACSIAATRRAATARTASDHSLLGMWNTPDLRDKERLAFIFHQHLKDPGVASGLGETDDFARPLPHAVNLWAFDLPNRATMQHGQQLFGGKVVMRQRISTLAPRRGRSNSETFSGRIEIAPHRGSVKVWSNQRPVMLSASKDQPVILSATKNLALD